jgi:hypothetical protein
MDVNNKYRFTLPKGDDKYINLPVEIKWDFLGRTDAVDEYQKNAVERVTGVAEDFEILRFAHAPYGDDDSKTDVKYDFHFFSVLIDDGNGNLVPTVPPNPSSEVTTAVVTDWVTSYIPEGFTTKDIYYYVKPFTKSFFKLDFYDSKEATIQTNYFTVIIPVQQGFTVTGITTSLMPPVNIKIPSFKLDYVGDKEGFFLYWLRKKKFLNINPDPTNTTETFYMTAKFFDARLGIFVKMMTTPQVLPLVPSLFQFDPKKFFYYKVVLDYTDNTYKIFDDVSGNRVGHLSSIKWYEYINP